MFFSRFLALFLFAALMVPIQGCAQHKRFRKNAENAFANRAWDDAVANAVNSLYQRPEKNEKAQEILDLAYPRFVTDYKEKIQRLSESSSNYKDSNTILERQMIVRLYETLIRYTSDVKNLPPAAFSNGIQNHSI